MSHQIDILFTFNVPYAFYSLKTEYEKNKIRRDMTKEKRKCIDKKIRSEQDLNLCGKIPSDHL